MLNCLWRNILYIKFEICCLLSFLGTEAGKQLAEGKTKIIYELPNNEVLVQSKDRISANNALRTNDLEGKAAISNNTACKVFEFLSKIGKSNIILFWSETQNVLVYYLV